MNIDLVTIVVRDYDEAIAFYTSVLGFELVEDSPARSNDGEPKRWVAPRGWGRMSTGRFDGGVDTFRGWSGP